MKKRFNHTKRLPTLPKINWKLFVTFIILILTVSLLIKCVPKYISGGESKVGYIVLDKSEVPQKIQEILPRYRMLERALAAKIEDEVYVIVTRGEKLTAGYAVDIKNIQVLKDNEDEKLVVQVLFKDPDPDALVAQVLSYPFVVAKTNLKDLPKKIDLEVKYGE
ncbi:protease complex subunit PrcB family protein [Serpentinicella alkaliphila]|uniref:Protease stability complex PrcB-like protein n=1 Tax=Serpentinicella alkaliphila TaxID=1734049 RepID=A0A4V2T4V1_9FIRM|nr:protease complex subunit PrcB family protein [Serpentinicella alkaliphila]QUH25672.1 protease complex subunit PrcB family protein [Serpentinicella alkaliphila]TCQ06614.1 protease stability complex PrcB-like protein [Serpentinicella alkaliphila]